MMKTTASITLRTAHAVLRAPAKPGLAILAALALALAAAPATPAHACGGDYGVIETVEDRAVSTVQASFSALAAGDAKAFKQLWSRGARVTTTTPAGSARSTPVAKAMKKWIKHRKGMAWTIDAVTATSDGAVVRATVVWNGTTYDDVLQLRDLGDRLVIVDKTTTPRAEVAAASSY